MNLCAPHKLTEGKQLLVRLKDNNIVTVGANMEEKYSEPCEKTRNKQWNAFDKSNNHNAPNKAIGWPSQSTYFKMPYLNRVQEVVVAHLYMVPQQCTHKQPYHLQRCHGTNHWPAHLMNCGTVSYAGVWQKTTEPQKEVCSDCYCRKSGLRYDVTGQSTQCTDPWCHYCDKCTS